MAENYYRKIKGKNYDRELLELAESLTSGRGDGRISLADAQKILSAVKDADAYTDIEKRTMHYVRDHFKFTKEADQWFRREIRSWAALRGASKKKTATTRSSARKKAVDGPESDSIDAGAAFAGVGPSSGVLSSPTGQSGKRRLALVAGAALILCVLVLFVFLIWNYSRSGRAFPGVADRSAVKTQDSKTDLPHKSAPETKAAPRGEKDKATKPVAGSRMPGSADSSQSGIEIPNRRPDATVPFRLDAARIEARGRLALSALAKRLKQQGQARLLLVGHTCNRGSDAFNQALALKRAQVAAGFLREQGVPADRVQVHSSGSSNPVAGNESAAGRRKNRRVEVFVLGR